MSILKRVQSGLFFEDTYRTRALGDNYTLSPSDFTRVSLTERQGFLRLKHGEEPLFLFIDDLENLNEYVVEFHNLYNPTSVGDEGGVIVYKNDTEKLELVEYFDEVKGVAMTYPYIRLHRNGDIYSAFYSNDGEEWEYLGSETFSGKGAKVGFFLYGSEGQDLDIDYIKVYKSPNVVIQGVPKNYNVKLFDGEGQLVSNNRATKDHANIFLKMLDIPFPDDFTIQITDDSGELVGQTELSHCELGDEYRFQYALDVHVIREEGDFQAKIETKNYLGNVENHEGDMYLERLIRVHNPFETYAFRNVQVEPVKYEDEGYLGVVLARDLDGVKSSFVTKLSLGDILPKKNVYMWIRAYRGDVEVTDLNFQLNFTSDN